MIYYLVLFEEDKRLSIINENLIIEKVDSCEDVEVVWEENGVIQLLKASVKSK